MTSTVDRYFVVIPKRGHMIGLFDNEQEAQDWANQSGTVIKSIKPVLLHQTHGAPDEEESHRYLSPN